MRTRVFPTHLGCCDGVKSTENYPQKCVASRKKWTPRRKNVDLREVMTTKNENIKVESLGQSIKSREPRRDFSYDDYGYKCKLKRKAL